MWFIFNKKVIDVLLNYFFLMKLFKKVVDLQGQSSFLVS